MEIIKREGNSEPYNPKKIEVAISRAFASVNDLDRHGPIADMVAEIQEKVLLRSSISVEEIQDIVEEKLMEKGHYQVAKNYIRYRAEHEKSRAQIAKFSQYISDKRYLKDLRTIHHQYDAEAYSIALLYQKFKSFLSEGLSEEQRVDQLVKAAVELTSQEAPSWEFIAARLLNGQISSGIDKAWALLGISSYIGRLHYLVEQNLMGSYILENYSDEDLAELERKLDYSRDGLLNYSGLDLIRKRYLIRNGDGLILERPQEMFMGIAMHLAIPEGERRVYWAGKIYDIISRLQLTMATPTMANARKPYHQLSSCFIDTVPDSLDGIYRSIDNFAQVSKHGGGMGLYFGKVRATGSDIRGFKGVAGGVIRWIKLANDTCVAVDQLGVRQGAVAVYLDVWHKDFPEFLQLRTNNGDDRMKAHDVFPAVCYPDYFWELVERDMESDWHMMCPHEVLAMKGYALEDSFGEEWKQKYLDCVADERISKRVMKVKDIVRLIIKSVSETGTPFAFYRDAVNRMNPNGNRGMIYASNLCTEIAQNMSPIESLDTEIIEENGDTVVVKRTKPGDFVVCNLASLVLGNIEVENQIQLQDIIATAVRALDNVIDLNYFPLPYAKISNQRYRSIGLGISGYHHMLAKRGIKWESEAHLDFADQVFENINYYAVSASAALAQEKGAYAYFEGSDWQTGAYFEKRRYTDERWKQLSDKVSKGIRNAYILAVAPTGSTSIIAGTTASVDPIMNRYFLEEKKGIIVPRVAPELNMENFWLYKSAHTIDQSWVLRAAGLRQRHIDQAQSLNLYITTDFSMRQVLNLFLQAWKEGVKTIYYVRSKSLDVEDCEVCSA